MEPINLLFTIDDGYVEQFKVTLFSIAQNLRASEEPVYVYILQKPRLQKENAIIQMCEQLNFIYVPVVIGDDDFKHAPITDRYPETIYYRLLAHEYLPKDLTRILYLDADILCINDIRPLYDMPIENNLYAACSHTSGQEVAETVNKIRLGNYASESYFNSGVLLMNLGKIRQKVKRKEIIAYIDKMGNRLFLPDQDVLTALYGHHIRLIPDEIYNYDTRYYLLYRAKSNDSYNLDWVMTHTVFLHFCGRDKPWLPKYKGIFASIYKHYEQLVTRKFN